MNSASDQTIGLVKSSSVDALQLEEYRALLRGHLLTLRALFRKLTGLEFSVVWAPTWPHQWSEQDLPTNSPLCRRFTSGNAAALERCQSCGTKHLAFTLKAGQEGHNFICHHGVRNFWFPIIVRGCSVGIAFAQAQDGAGRGSSRTQTTNTSDPAASLNRGESRPVEAKPMTASEFKQVAMLLQFIFHHAQTSALALCDQKELARVQHALLELQSVARRLREQLHRVIPALATTPPDVQPEAHSKQIVHDLLDCIGQTYTQPITLHQCAAKLGLNVSYLSHLFSCAVGMPFKTYLTELRIEKARELLGNPAATITQVATAVGYASENRFRIAFKKVTSLSPRTWRETLRMSCPALLLWFLDHIEFLDELALPSFL